MELEIYDLPGNRLLSNTLRGVSELQEAIDLSAFPDGNYVLTLRMEAGRVYSKKVVKTSE
ncbi:MAG: T9SS type A sorting domain-containing protein [Saprospirales bacterium]|nr:T9SS type A sorting domain-containing protein [Saprospirales bacterium]